MYFIQLNHNLYSSYFKSYDYRQSPKLHLPLSYERAKYVCETLENRWKQ